MKDDPEQQMNDDSLDDRIYSLKQKRIESDSSRLFPTMIVVLLVLMVAAGIYYFITRTESDATLQSKFASLEEKLSRLEKQIVDLQGKTMAGGPDPSVLQRVEALSQKVEELEKRTGSATESKARTSPPKPPVSSSKQYHTVQKGETLPKISKKYGIPVEELRKLNGLSRNQPVRAGQKLLVSAGG